MLKKIEKLIDKQEVGLYPDEIVELASLLFSFVEKEGMLPVCKNRQLEHPNARFIYKWDDENE